MTATESILQTPQTIRIFCEDWPDYELLDSGQGQKLERFGPYIVARGEAKAWWTPDLPQKDWARAVAFHSGEENTAWTLHQAVPREWLVRIENLTIQARFLGASKHIGIFPEKITHWRWLAEQIRTAKINFGTPPVQVLNLFGYTGIASLVAAAGGAHVTHVDSAKGVVTWARYNQQLSGLDKLPIRWIVDDAVKFVQRESRRNKRYDIIILDPPAFGRGPKNEIWKIEDQLPGFLADCRAVLSDAALFVLLTMYSINQSALLLGNLLQDMMRGAGGAIDVGELCLKPKASPKLLAMSHFGRWTAR